MIHHTKLSKSDSKRFWDITLVLTIISVLFALLWVTYCNTYFRALSFPYDYTGLPNTVLLTKLILIIVKLNIPIVSLYCIAYWIFSKVDLSKTILIRILWGINIVIFLLFS